MNKRDEVRNCLRAIMGFTVADSNRVCDRLAELLVPGDTVRYLYSCLKGWHQACDGGPVDQRCSCACHTKPAAPPEPETRCFWCFELFARCRCATTDIRICRTLRADRDALKAERDRLRSLLNVVLECDNNCSSCRADIRSRLETHAK